MSDAKHPTTIPLQCPGDLDQEEIDALLSREQTREVRKLKPTAFLRFVEMGPQVRVLEQGFAPEDWDGGMLEWREVPTVSRKDAGYG